MSGDPALQICKIRKSSCFENPKPLLSYPVSKSGLTAKAESRMPNNPNAFGCDRSKPEPFSNIVAELATNQSTPETRVRPVSRV